MKRERDTRRKNGRCRTQKDVVVVNGGMKCKSQKNKSGEIKREGNNNIREREKKRGCCFSGHSAAEEEQQEQQVKNKRSQWKTKKQCCGWWCCGGAATAIPLMARQQLMKRPCWGLTQPRQQRQLKPNCPADAILADGRARAQSNNDTKKRTQLVPAPTPGYLAQNTHPVCVYWILHTWKYLAIYGSSGPVYWVVHI